MDPQFQSVKTNKPKIASNYGHSVSKCTNKQILDLIVDYTKWGLLRLAQLS